MEDPNSTLLPYILETLSRTPELCDTFENLCKNVHEQLIEEQNGRYHNVQLAIQRALNVGQSLGIITLNNETIRVPFNFRQNKNYRNMNNHLQLKSQPVASGIVVPQQQKPNPNQNNQPNKGAQQKKEPERTQKQKKEDEDAQNSKYIKQLELDDSDFSLNSTSDVDVKARGRSRSQTRRRPRERSYSRPTKRKARRGRRARR